MTLMDSCTRPRSSLTNSCLAAHTVEDSLTELERQRIELVRKGSSQIHGRAIDLLSGKPFSSQRGKYFLVNCRSKQQAKSLSLEAGMQARISNFYLINTRCGTKSPLL